MMFDYARPSDWSVATRLLAEPGTVAKMGGCDVLTRFRSGRLQARLVVGLNLLPGVSELNVDAGGVRIGAAITLAQLAGNRQFALGWPLLANVLATIASPAIRASATVVGNVAQGWSVGDLVPLFQVCGAELDIHGPSGQRRMSVVDYAKMATNGALQPGEVIAALTLKPVGCDSRMTYERFSFKEGFDLPLVSVVVAATLIDGVCSNVRVAAVGGMTMPARCAGVEVALADRRIDDGSIETAVTAITKWADPPSDFRASADYRRHVLGATLRRALSKLAAA
jgi:xanthine dehydrogenase small subunit